jgi:hypothetical protein
MKDLGKITKICARIIMVFFIAVIGLNFLIYRNNKLVSVREKREYKKIPTLTYENLTGGKFAKEFEEYLIDNFFIRDFSIDLTKSIKSVLSINTYELEDSLIFLGDSKNFFDLGDNEDNTSTDILDKINSVYKDQNAIPAEFASKTKYINYGIFLGYILDNLEREEEEKKKYFR